METIVSCEIEVELAENSAGPRDLHFGFASDVFVSGSAVHRLDLFRGLGEIGFNAGHLGMYSWMKLVLDFHGELCSRTD